jgi:hypothetical protein
MGTFREFRRERECTGTAHCAVKGSLSSWDLSVYIWIQFVIAFTNQNIFHLFFLRRILTSQLTIFQNLKQFKLVNLYLQGFEDWSCGHWRTYLNGWKMYKENILVVNWSVWLPILPNLNQTHLVDNRIDLFMHFLSTSCSGQVFS